MSVIAITGTGSLFGQAIIKSIKNSSFKNNTLIGMDYFENTVGSNWVDKNFVLPDLLDIAITESIWLKSVQSIINDNHVEILFVGVDFELPLFSKYKNHIERLTSCIVIVSDERTIEIADDKYLTYEFLKDNNFNYPLSFLESEIDAAIERDLIHFPMIIKPRKGYRSVDVHVVNDKLNLNQKISYIKNPIIQEYIGSDESEYTCGVIAFNGDVKKSIVLNRTLKDGNTHTTSLRLNQFGVCNFQLRMDQGVPKIFEINARHSGTTYIRSLYGFNEVEYILEFILNEKEIDFDMKEGKVQRYFDEFFVGLEE